MKIGKLETTQAERPTVPRMAISVDEAAQSSGLSRSFLYGEMKAGRLHYLKAGSRRLVQVAELEAFLARLAQGSAIA